MRGIGQKVGVGQAPGKVIPTDVYPLSMAVSIICAGQRAHRIGLARSEWPITTPASVRGSFAQIQARAWGFPR